MFTFLSIAVSIALSVNSAPSFNNVESNGTPIEIEIKDGTPGGVPRMPSLTPIQGVVLGDTIFLSFLDNISVISVEICEFVDGLILQTLVDSSLLSSLIPFGGGPGDYTITFTLSTGLNYIGTFVIN